MRVILVLELVLIFLTAFNSYENEIKSFYG